MLHQSSALNVQSIYAKIDHLRSFVSELDDMGISFDVLCLQETWLHGDHDPTLLEIDGYQLIKLSAQGLSPLCSPLFQILLADQ